MENGFAILETPAEVRQFLEMQPLGGQWLSLRGLLLLLKEDKWNYKRLWLPFKNGALKIAKILHMCRPQLHLAAGGGTTHKCRATSCCVFSAGMDGWTVVLLPLSHFSQRSDTAPAEKAFVQQRHSMSGMRTTIKARAGGCFLPEYSSETGPGYHGSSVIVRCYLSANEASEVIKTPSVRSKS